MKLRSLISLAVFTASGAAFFPATAASGVPPCRDRPPVYAGNSSRVVSGASGSGMLAEQYLAVLPEGYTADLSRRYPVVYLLHGLLSSADEYLVCMNLLETSASSKVIVVIPQGTGDGYWIDWHNGKQLRERALIETLLPHIDATFRTIPDRDHRAVAGLSMGGYGAMVQAARHPDLFAAAASFSGVVAISEPEHPLATPAWIGSTLTSPGAFADPITGKAWRRQHDPASLADSLRGLTLFLSSGNGVPCTVDEAARFVEPDPTQPTIEPAARLNQQTLHRALERSGVPHIYRAYSCGAHTYMTFQRELEDAWPHLLAAIGAG